MEQRILLSTVFKPFGIDDQYGREENLPELLASQVTRVQGIFTPRMWHANSGLHLIAANCGLPTTVLEWPSIEEFISELQKNDYTYVGISFIPSTLKKMRKMAETVRLTSPKSKIILGGFGTAIPDLESYVDVDYICKGEGIKFFRELTKNCICQHFHHPLVTSKTIEFLGLPIPPIETAQIAAGVGCTKGCDFCLTSAYFNCEYTPFLDRGEDLFLLVKNQILNNNITDFWLIDENFLENSNRFETFHTLLVRENENIPFFNFDMLWSSADNLKKVNPRILSEAGISTVWIGFESAFSEYAKNSGVNIKQIISELAEYGICTLLSCILFNDYHNEINLAADIDTFISLGQTYSQFIPLSAYPGTALFKKLSSQKRLLDMVPWEERHGLATTSHLHPNFPLWKQKDILLRAFEKEYDQNGPSALRIFETRMNGYKTFLHSQNPVLQKRAFALKHRLCMQLPWVLASTYLVKEIHKPLVLQIVEHAQHLFGFEIINKNKQSGKMLARMALKAIENRQGKLLSDLQPVLRTTHYNYTKDKANVR
jgi:hypothetical protein